MFTFIIRNNGIIFLNGLWSWRIQFLIFPFANSVSNQIIAWLSLGFFSSGMEVVILFFRVVRE